LPGKNTVVLETPGLKSSGAGAEVTICSYKIDPANIDYCDDAGSGQPGCEEIEDLKRRIIELQKENSDLTNLLQGNRHL
jgi:hypothetical protein